MLRNVIAVIAGVLTSGVLIAAVEVFSHQLYPPPSGFDFNDKEALKALMRNAPTGSLVFVILAHVLGSFSGSIVASLIAESYRMRMSMLIGVVVTIMAIANMLMIPHPVWYMVVDLLAIIPVAYIGGWLALKIKS